MTGRAATWWGMIPWAGRTLLAGSTPLPDALGSVRQTVDAAGTLLDAREWTPYGVEVGDAQSGLGYAGEWFDAAVGLQYLRARWYDAEVGRFTQEDAFPPRITRPQDFNLYSYVHNSPLMYIDPSGYDLMLVGGTGGNFEPATWSAWLRAYKGWDAEHPEWLAIEKRWREMLDEKEKTTFESLNDLLDVYGIRIFGWGGTTLAEGYRLAGNPSHKVEQETTGLLSQAMETQQDITLVGWSKGAALVALYTERLALGDALVQPQHIVMLGQPNFSDILYFPLN